MFYLDLLASFWGGVDVCCLMCVYVYACVSVNVCVCGFVYVCCLGLVCLFFCLGRTVLYRATPGARLTDQH